MYSNQMHWKLLTDPGNNVGTDEFNDNAYLNDYVFGLSEMFGARDVVTGELKAFILLQNASYTKTRGPQSTSATILIFRDETLISDDVVYGALVDVALEFTMMIDIGYVQCFVDVALCHYGLVRQLRQRGFYTAAIVPRAVDIAKRGLQENAIMCKDFGLPDKPVGCAFPTKNYRFYYNSVVFCFSFKTPKISTNFTRIYCFNFKQRIIFETKTLHPLI